MPEVERGLFLDDGVFEIDYQVEDSYIGPDAVIVLRDGAGFKRCHIDRYGLAFRDYWVWQISPNRPVSFEECVFVEK